MIILPFTHISKKGSFGTLHCFKLFLANGGSQFWKTEENEISIENLQVEYLEPNGFSGASVIGVDEIFLVLLPPTFDTSSFYSWGEEDAIGEVDLWRTFYWMETENEKGWERQADSLKIENLSLTQIWRMISAAKV
jgi:hypothetical protein